MVDRKSSAAELMRATGPWSVQVGASMAQAARALTTSGLPMVPVCGTDSKLAGIFTAAMLVAAVTSDEARAGRLVDELMNTDPPFVADYASLEWVLIEMQDAHLWALPVVDAEHRLLGIIALPELTDLVFPPLLVEIWEHAALPN